MTHSWWMALGCMLLTGPALACSCLAKASIVDKLDPGDAVVVVRLDRISAERSCTSDGLCTPFQVADYTLVESLRGDPPTYAPLASGYGGGNCGVPLIAGAEYIVVLAPGARGLGSCNSAGPFPPAEYRDPRDQQAMRDYLDAMRRRMDGQNVPSVSPPRTLPFDFLPPPPTPPQE